MRRLPSNQGETGSRDRARIDGAKKCPTEKNRWAIGWWTRRELNPRPKAISGQDYMFSSQFDLAADTSMSTLAANQPT